MFLRDLPHEGQRNAPVLWLDPLPSRAVEWADAHQEQTGPSGDRWTSPARSSQYHPLSRRLKIGISRPLLSCVENWEHIVLKNGPEGYVAPVPGGGRAIGFVTAGRLAAGGAKLVRANLENADGVVREITLRHRCDLPPKGEAYVGYSL